MKRDKIIKIVAKVAVIGILVGGGIVLYLFNMPHRNVQDAKSDFSLISNQLVLEYLHDNDAAHQKYLSDDGDSKILSITVTV